MALTKNITKARVWTTLAFSLLIPVVAGGQNTADPAQLDAPAVELTLPQARQLTVRALKAGRPKLAYTLSQGLLKADPQSSFAHFTLANAQALLGQAKPARKSAARAYRFADSKLHRFEAAELAARLSFADERPTLTQLWLRRAVQNAPNEQVEQQLGRDYGVVRAKNPFSFSIRGGFRPSNNVNGGSNTEVQIIDGLPFTGQLSGSAQALSGTIGTLDTTLRYRLRGSEKSRTEVAARLFVRRTFLTDGAREQAPDVENSDYGSTFAEVRLDHTFAVGDKGNTARIGTGAGQYWFAEDRSYHFVNVNAGHSWRVGERTSLSLDASLEHRISDRADILDSTYFVLSGGLRHARPNGDKLSFSLGLRETDSDFVNSRNSSAILSANYAFAKQLGPAKISAGLVAGYSDFPDYVSLVAVPGGRQDRTVYANINFFFPDVDYAGFAPNLRVSAGRKFSNVSRFDTEELSVSLGIQSKF